MIARVTVAFLALCAFAAPSQAYIQGIDVYTGQGAINWTSVKNAGITFAFTKATEGVDFIDTRFTTNMTNAKAAGVLIGPYHFARPDSSNTNPLDAANEANDFVDSIAPYYAGNNLTLRPVLDLENLAGVETAAQEKTFLSQWVRNFAAVVHNRLGTDIMLYMNRDFAQHYMATDLNKYPLWVAKPISQTASAATQNNFASATPPTSTELGPWTSSPFWQWSWGGNVAGLTPLDRDAFNGTTQQLSAYIPDFHAGDFDGNGVVDDRDYVRWRNTLGTAVHVGTAADANFSGVIDAGDYAIWRSNFGKTYTTARSGSGLDVASVPEPGSCLLLVLGALTGLAAGCGRLTQL